jgi:hypothetical protein
MKIPVLKIGVLVIISLGFYNLQAQDGMITSFSNVTSAGGTMNYTLGQFFQATLEGPGGSMSSGMQQPLEVLLTGIDKAEEVEMNIRVFPNPTTGEIQITLEDRDNKVLKYSLFNAAGVLLIQQELGKEPYKITLDKYRPGIYFMTLLTTRDEILTYKIIKR